MANFLIKYEYWFRFKLIPFTFCGLCKFPSKKPVCDKCVEQLKSIAYINNNSALSQNNTSCYLYKSPLRELLIRYKYQKQIQLKWVLGYLLKLYIDKLIQPIDYIIPIPTHKIKQRKRGFDHVSELLAFYIATNGQYKINNRVLIKTKLHTAQVTLNRKEREHNLHNTFKLVGNVKGKNILLIDDVSTTGTTLNEVTNRLKQDGATNVYSLTLLKNIKFETQV